MRRVMRASRSSLAAGSALAGASVMRSVGKHDVDDTVGELGAHLVGSLLGELHRCLADGRSDRLHQVIDGLLDGDVAAGERALPGERRLDAADDGLQLHRRSAPATIVVARAWAACAAVLAEPAHAVGVDGGDELGVLAEG